MGVAEVDVVFVVDDDVEELDFEDEELVLVEDELVGPLPLLVARDESIYISSLLPAPQYS